MRVYLDDECVSEQSTGLAAGLRAAVDQAQTRGRIVIEVHADGEPLPGESLDDPDSHSAPIGELRLKSAPPRTFLKMTLHEAADALEQAERAQKEAADLLERGDAKSGFDRLGVAFVLWDAARDVLSKSQQILGIDLDTLRQDPPSVADSVASLCRTLDAARDSIGKEDWATLSDLLRFDLAEEGARWREMLRDLAERIGAEDR